MPEKTRNIRKISASGSIIIPKEIRERYNLKTGDKFHFIDYGGVISLVPLSKNPIEKASGCLKGDVSLTKALLQSRQEDKNR